MPPGKKTPKSSRDRHDFSKAIPAFDTAMRKIVEVPKVEIERRLQAEREAKAAKK